MIPVGNSTTPKTNYYGASVGFTFAAFLLYLAIINGNQEAETQLIFKDSPFQFHVYCPISSQDHLQQYVHLIKNAKQSDLQAINISNTYVVYIKARANQTNNKNASAGLYYCGLARKWTGTCKDAEIICSSPGPMFFLPVGQPISIIWVNDINNEGLNWIEDDCYDPQSNEMECSIYARSEVSKAKSGCTYKDPTDFDDRSVKTSRVSKKAVPISPHIHGMSTRPIYDGNPLSWFNNIGDRGIGYFSLDNPEYFQQFETIEKFYSIPYSMINKNLKVMHVPNSQQAGNLFYHDHAMRSTKYNVMNGLNGLYILYDEKTEKDLPEGPFEKFIVFSHLIDGDARENLVPIEKPVDSTKPSMNMNHGGILRDHRQVIYTLNASDIFSRDDLYRFRILNGHFDNLYNDISFAIYYDKKVDKKGKVTITEIDPSNASFDLNTKRKLINFTIIGADSTLFHEAIHNVHKFDLGVAQRLQILIKFDEINGIPREVNSFYLVCEDYNEDKIVIKYKFNLDQFSRNVPRDIRNPTDFSRFDNPFTNLSLVPNSKIAVNRMRPLTSRPLDTQFLINGHYMFDMGASDLPQIGTVEDWYFINNIWQAHPIHFHLVNFQVVQTLSLKKTPEDCTFYELDFYRSTNYSRFRRMNNTALCNYLNKEITEVEANMLFDHMAKYHLQNETVSTVQFGKVSGFNVLEKINPKNNSDRIYVQPDSTCKFNSMYKYICDETSDRIPQHYRRWKDTAIIHPFSVSVLRVRWTKTEYDETIESYPYFNIPEEQLMEFPGYVYHCHILPHEDNEMMRSFMLQPSDIFVQNATSYINKKKINQAKSKISLTWEQKMRKINANLSCAA